MPDSRFFAGRAPSQASELFQSDRAGASGCAKAEHIAAAGQNQRVTLSPVHGAAWRTMWRSSMEIAHRAARSVNFGGAQETRSNPPSFRNAYSEHRALRLPLHRTN